MNFTFLSLQNLRAVITPELKSPLFLTIALTGAEIVLLIVTIFSLQPEVPLFYSLSQASQQLVPKFWLFLFAGFSLSITIIHFAIIVLFKQLDILLLKLFAWTTVAVQILLLMALVRIIIVVS